MKKVLFAVLLVMSVVSFTLAGFNHSTAPVNQLNRDTIPTDTVPDPEPPRPDTTLLHIQ